MAQPEFVLSPGSNQNVTEHAGKRKLPFPQMSAKAFQNNKTNMIEVFWGIICSYHSKYASVASFMKIYWNHCGNTLKYLHRSWNRSDAWLKGYKHFPSISHHLRVFHFQGYFHFLGRVLISFSYCLGTHRICPSPFLVV